jgi:hypothetical protein
MRSNRKGKIVRKRLAWLIATGLIAGSLAIPGVAVAHTNEAIAETGGMELALLGSELTVDIDLDEFGNLAMVDVYDATVPPPDPEAAPAEEDQELSDPHRFRFEDEEDGTRLDVMAKKHKLTSKVKAGALEDLVGSHTWSAVLFPESDLTDPTFVTFEVTADGQIFLEDAGIAPLPSCVVPVTKTDDDDDDDEDAAVTIIFTWNGYTKILKIKVDVDDEDGEDGPTAVLKVELRAKDRQRQRGMIEDFEGDHTWTGLLCDGTLAMVDYSIDETGVLGRGAVTFEPPDGDPEYQQPSYEVKDQERGFWVRFDEGKARVHVRFGQTEEGEWDLKVDAKTTEKCKHHDDENDERSKKDRSERERNRDHEDKRKNEGDD